MEEPSKNRFIVATAVLVAGVFIILEGLQITHFGKPAGNTPYWVITVAGFVFFFAGVAVLAGTTSKLNDFFAFIITALMGACMAWISLYADESEMTGNMGFLSDLTGVPFGRLMFGLCALMCFAIAAYAFKLFYTKLFSQVDREI